MAKFIAIVGATGLQGGSVLKTLYAAGGYKIRALSRNPNSDSAKKLAAKYPDVEWVQADLNDASSLCKALTGVDVVFAVTDFYQKDTLEKVAAGDKDAEFTQGKNIVDAAIDAGVNSIIYSSLDSMKQLSGGKYPDILHLEGKHKVEEYISSKADKIKGYFIYLGVYMENYIRFSRISPEDNQTVEFTVPLKPTTKIPLVDTANDTGHVVKYILEHPDECLGKVVEVSGGYYEAQEMAKAFTEATGKSARYTQIPYEAAGMYEMSQMFKAFDEFGSFGGRSDFLEYNKEMDYTFVTPVEFWKNRNWDGPSK
ncbi:hypothetical protein H4S08_004496 [Coemansia sp. RSA 1365]|nr:hypothetical protein H4S08_004496 [Coemansia sp. RSA 1365]